MTVLDFAFDEIAVLVPEKELREIISDSQMHEKLFTELFTLAMQVCGESAKSTTVLEIRREIQKIELWIREHYIDLRPTLSGEVKRLYLTVIAFPVHER